MKRKSHFGTIAISDDTIYRDGLILVSETVF